MVKMTPIQTIKKRPPKAARPAAKPALDPRLRCLALAFSRFEEWFHLAGQRSKDAFRVFPAAELRLRFSNLQISIVGMDDALPPAARRSFDSVREGIRTELQESTGREVALGIYFCCELSRLAELLKLYGRENGWQDKGLAPVRRDGEKLTPR
jgi:hypothetical protein